MGFFSKSKEDKFKDQFVDYCNFLADYSYSGISGYATANKIVEGKRKLIYLAREFSDPCNSYFKMYSNNTSVFGQKRSIAEGVLFALYATDFVIKGGHLDQYAHAIIFNEVDKIYATSEGKRNICEVIKNSNP